MASIVIKDLIENTELDRQAMTAIIGGSRRGGRPLPSQVSGPALFRTTRIVDYPAGFGQRRTAPAGQRG